jgi:hypothetical protein
MANTMLANCKANGNQPPSATSSYAEEFPPADRLAQILGATGMTVITQLSSFFLVCIGVQIAWNGIKALLESLTLHFG